MYTLNDCLKVERTAQNVLTDLTQFLVGSPSSAPAKFRGPVDATVSLVICFANIAPNFVCGTNSSISFKDAPSGINEKLLSQRYTSSCESGFFFYFRFLFPTPIGAIPVPVSKISTGKSIASQCLTIAVAVPVWDTTRDQQFLAYFLLCPAGTVCSVRKRTLGTKSGK